MSRLVSCECVREGHGDISESLLLSWTACWIYFCNFMVWKSPSIGTFPLCSTFLHMTILKWPLTVGGVGGGTTFVVYRALNDRQLDIIAFFGEFFIYLFYRDTVELLKKKVSLFGPWDFRSNFSLCLEAHFMLLAHPSGLLCVKCCPPQ